MMSLSRKRVRSTLRLMKRNWTLYLLLLPAVIYIFLFNYLPMYGVQIAFKNFTIAKGVAGSPWVGLKWFEYFFGSPKCLSIIWNTLILNLYMFAAGFPAPILLALMLHNVPGRSFKRVTQTVAYLPHFISTVVVVTMLNCFTSVNSGFINTLIKQLGGDSVFFMGRPEYFRHLYVLSGIWQEMGWGSIIYLAALAGVDPSLHEAATVDGASRFKRVLHVDLPAILPTIVIMLILRFGSIMSIGFEKVFLLQNDLNLSYSEVISTYVYKVGLSGGGKTDFSYATAIGMFNSVVNLVLIVVVNFIAGKVGNTSLW